MAERIIRKNEKLESTLPLTISAQYGLIDQNEFFDKRIASKDVRGYYLIKKGEFAYNKSTSVDAPLGAIKRLDKYKNGVLSTLYILFKIIDDTSTSSDYLVTYYVTDLWHRGIQSIAAEGARNHGLLNIAPNDFFETMLSIPLNISEQKKVGDFFISLDHLITLHQSKSFAHIFKAIDNSTLYWEQRKLGEVCNIITKQTGFDYSSTIKPALFKEKADNTYSFIQNKDFNGTTINMDTDFFIPISVAEKFPNIVLDRPSILISISGRIGNVGFYSCVHKAFIGGAVGICKLKYNDDGKFIIHELESEYGQKYFYSLIKASSHANITVEDIRNMELIFPKKKRRKDMHFNFFFILRPPYHPSSTGAL